MKVTQVELGFEFKSSPPLCQLFLSFALVQLRVVKHIHCFVQTSLFSISSFSPPKCVHLLDKYSPFSPPQPLVTVTTFLHFLSLYICLFLAPHINGITQYLSFCVWLFSCSIRFSRFIHGVASVRISFLLKAE